MRSAWGGGGAILKGFLGKVSPLESFTFGNKHEQTDCAGALITLTAAL